MVSRNRLLRSRPPRRVLVFYGYPEQSPRLPHLLDIRMEAQDQGADHKEVSVHVNSVHPSLCVPKLLFTLYYSWLLSMRQDHYVRFLA